MIRLGVLLIALAVNVPNVDPPDPPPPGVGMCPVRGTITLPCDVADVYYYIDDLLRNAPVRI